MAKLLRRYCGPKRRRMRRRADVAYNFKWLGGPKQTPRLSKKEKNMATKFGMTLRMYRLAKGLSQADLARAAEVSPAYIGDIERGERRPPSARVVAALCEMLALGPLDEMDLRIASRRYLYCPHCKHGFLPTDAHVAPENLDELHEERKQGAKNDRLRRRPHEPKKVTR